MATVARRHAAPTRRVPAMPRRKQERTPISKRNVPLPGRKQVPKKEVRVNKIPYGIKSRFKDAIINKTIDVIFEKGEGAIVRLYDNIIGGGRGGSTSDSLGNFLNNAPQQQSGEDAKAVAEEAFKQVIKADNNDAVRAIVEGDEAVVYVVRKGTGVGLTEVKNFVTQDEGDPVVHEFDKEAFGNNVKHIVTKEVAPNFANTDEYVVKHAGGIISNLV
ncbi:Uncharacterized protein RDABS01_032991 [Bienertia sinuspersici]